MNILGMGPMELLLIVVLALIVFGPAKLPEIMAQVGKAIADFRRATSELSDEFNRTIQSELQETRAMVDDAKSTLTDAKTSLVEVHSSVNSVVTGTPAPQRTAVPPESLPAPNGVNGVDHTETLTNGSLPAVATPPPSSTPKWSWETAAPAPAPPSVAEEPKPGETAGHQPGSSDTPRAATPPSTPPAGNDHVTPADKQHPTRDDLAPPY